MPGPDPLFYRGLAIALPFGLAFWAVVIGAARLAWGWM